VLCAEGNTISWTKESWRTFQTTSLLALTSGVIDLSLKVPLDSKWVILERFFPVNLLTGTEDFGGDKATKYCGQSDMELQDITVGLPDSRQISVEEKARRSGRQRCADCCRHFIAFLFSTVGSCCLMVGYVVLGGFVFRGLEADHERQTKTDMQKLRLNYVELLWNMTEAKYAKVEKRRRKKVDRQCEGRPH